MEVSFSFPTSYLFFSIFLNEKCVYISFYNASHHLNRVWILVLDMSDLIQHVKRELFQL